MYSSKYAPQPTAASTPPVTSPTPQNAAPLETKLDQQPTPVLVAAPIQDHAPPIASGYEPAYATDPSIDEFAQTRPPDDLFNDDFTPITESTLVYDPPPPVPGVQSTPPPPQQQFREPRYDSNRGLPRGTPRGPRGNRGGRGRGNAAPRSPPESVVPAAPSTDITAEATAGAEPEATKTEDAVAPEAVVASPPTGPAAVTAGATKPVASVRGDRSLTGGPAKKKLTETELNDKLAAMSLKNKALTEAHEKALADQDAFAVREKEAAAKRKIETAERKVMLGEREANRQRKLKVMGGREWDAEKNEEDFKDEGRRAKRGAHGGVTGTRTVGLAIADGDVVDGSRDGSQRGRGGRGRGGGGRGRGRGEHSNAAPSPRPTKTQTVPKTEDFPDLPPSATPVKTDAAPSRPKDLEFPIKKKTNQVPKMDTDVKAADAKPKLESQASLGFTPKGEKKSWADQVEAASP